MYVGLVSGTPIPSAYFEYGYTPITFMTFLGGFVYCNLAFLKLHFSCNKNFASNLLILIFYYLCTISGQLTNEQLNNLKDWKIALDADEESFLTLEGRDEMILLAERMQKRFPNAIKQRYSNKTFLVS